MVDTELQNILPWQFSNLEIEEDEASLQEKANYKDVQASLTARKGWLTRVNDRCKLDHQYYEKFKLTGQASFKRFSETKLSLEIRAAKVANAFRRLLQLLPMQHEQILQEFDETIADYYKARDVLDALLDLCDPNPVSKSQPPKSQAAAPKVLSCAKDAKPPHINEKPSIFSDLVPKMPPSRATNSSGYNCSLLYMYLLFSTDMALDKL